MDNIELGDDFEIAFQIGDVVDVLRRMWPGINKPGGVARITKIRYDEEEYSYTYDVSYLLGGRETKVESQFIKLQNEDESRKRATLGRCKYCKSFIRDCGHDQTVNPFVLPSQEVKANVENKKKVKSQSRMQKHSTFVQGLTSDWSKIMENVNNEEYLSFTQQDQPDQANLMDLQDFDIPYSEGEDSEYEGVQSTDNINKEINDEDFLRTHFDNVPSKKRKRESEIMVVPSTTVDVVDVPIVSFSINSSESVKQTAKDLLTKITNSCIAELSTSMNAKFINNSNNDLDLNLTGNSQDSYEKSLLAIGDTGILIGMELLGQSNLLIHSLLKKAEVIRVNIGLINEQVSATSHRLSVDNSEKSRELAERIIELEDEQSTLFHTIVRAGVDVFNIAVKRVHKLLRKIPKNRQLQSRLELLELRNNTLVDVEWRSEHDRGISALRNLNDDFENVFGATCYDVLYSEENVDASSSDDYMNTGYDSDDVGGVIKAVEPRRARVRDAAEEAGTIKRKHRRKNAIESESSASDEENVMKVVRPNEASTSQSSQLSTGSDGNSMISRTHHYNFERFEKGPNTFQNRRTGVKTPRNKKSSGNKSRNRQSELKSWLQYDSGDEEISLLRSVDRRTARNVQLGDRNSKRQNTFGSKMRRAFGIQIELDSDDERKHKNEKSLKVHRNHSTFYKQVKFVKNYTGTGKIIILEGNLPLSTETKQINEVRQSTNAATEENLKNRRDNVTFAKVPNLNLSHAVSASRSKRASHKLLDSLSENIAQSTSNVVQRLQQPAKQIHDINNSINTLLNSRISAFSVNSRIIEELFTEAQAKWASDILNELSLQFDFMLPRIVDAVIQEIIASSVSGLKVILLAFNRVCYDNHKLSSSKISNSQINSHLTNLANTCTNKFSRAFALFNQLLLMTNQTMMFHSEQYIQKVFDSFELFEKSTLLPVTQNKSKVNSALSQKNKRLASDSGSSDSETELAETINSFKSIGLNTPCDKLSVFVFLSVDSPADDLMFWQICLYYRNKIASIRLLVEDLLFRALCRMRSEESIDITLEEEDWKTLLLCENTLSNVLAEVLETLVANNRLLLAVVHSINDLSDSTVLSELLDGKRNDFVSGLEGRTAQFISLLACVISVQEYLKCLVKDSFDNKCWSSACAQKQMTKDGLHRYDHWVTFDRIMFSLGGRVTSHFPLLSNKASSALVHVNPAVKVVSSSNKVQQTSNISSETLWSLVGLFSYFLQRVSLENQIVQAKSNPAESNIVCKTSIVGDWSLIYATCVNGMQLDTGSEDFKSLFGMLSNISRLSSLALNWTNPVSSVEIFLQSVLKSVPILANLPIYEDVSDSLTGLENYLKNGSKSKDLKDEGKVAVLIGYDSYCKLNSGYDSGNVTYSRMQFHEQLLLIVSSLFNSCGLTNPYKAYFNGSSNNNTSIEPSCAIVDQIRFSCQSLLCNILNQTMMKVNIYSGNTEIIDDVKLQELTMKRLKVELKKLSDSLFSIFQSKPTFITGLLLCLLMKEITTILGNDWVNSKDVNYQSKLMTLIMETNISYTEKEKDSKSSLLVAKEKLDDQGTCLVLFASLITFNPMPVLRSTATFPLTFNGFISAQNDDLQTLIPVIQVMEKVKEMCSNNIIDEGIPSLQTKRLLLVCLSTCSTIVKYLSSAIVTSFTFDNESTHVVAVLPVYFLRTAISVATLNIQKDFGTVLGSHSLASVYLLCSLISYLKSWQADAINTASYCLEMIRLSNQSELYKQVHDVIMTGLVELDQLLLIIIKTALPPLKIACAQTVKLCSDADESFSFLPRSELLTSMWDDDILKFVSQSSGKSGNNLLNVLSKSGSCHAIVTSFSHITEMVAFRASMNVNSSLSVLDQNHLKLSSLHSSLSEFLDRISTVKDSSTNRNDSNLQHLLKTIYWERILHLCFSKNIKVATQLQSEVTVNHQIFSLFISGSCLSLVKKNVLNQVHYDKFINSLVLYSEKVVKFDGIPGKYSSQLFRLASILVSINKNQTSSNNKFDHSTMLEFMKLLSRQTDYSSYEKLLRVPQGSLKSKFQSEEATTNTEICNELFRILRFAEMCLFKTANSFQLHEIRALLKKIIALSISFVESQREVTFHRCVISLDQMIMFYGEFVVDDVRLLLENAFGSQSTAEELIINNLLAYMMSICHTSYSRKCITWRCLLQLLLITHKKSIQYGSLQTRWEEVSLLWAVALCLTPSLLNNLRVFWSIYGNEYMVERLYSYLKPLCSESSSVKIVRQLMKLIDPTISPDDIVSNAVEDNKVLEFRQYLLISDEEVWSQSCLNSELSVLLDTTNGPQQQKFLLAKEDWMRTRDCLKKHVDDLSVVFSSIISEL